MARLVESIRHNLLSLVRFDGRDPRATFWPYAAFVLILVMVGMTAVMLPAISESLARMQRFAAEHPEMATVQSGPGGYSISIRGNHPELMPDMGALFGKISIVFVLAVLLLTGAVVRRLHDGGKSRLWGLLPLPFFTFAAVAVPKVFAQDAPSIGVFLAIFFNNLLYLASLGLLAALLAKPSVAHKR